MFKILHVDDDKLDNQLFSTNLIKTSDLFDLDWTDTAEKALELIRSGAYDCILCDYQMPGISGLQLLSSLRQQGNDIPFIFYTGQGNESIAAEALRMGADDYYSKEEGFAKLDRLINSMKKTIAAYKNRQSKIFAENVIHQLEMKTAGLTGEDFLETLVLNLAETLNMKFAFVGEITGEKREEIRTLYGCSDGEMLDTITYKLKDTPCEKVIGKMACVYPTNVQQAFPKDKYLVEMGVDSYIGIPLFDSGHEPLGNMVLQDNKPMPESSFIRSLLVVFASRASAEIERIRYTRSLKESEERYKLLFENNVGGVYRTAEDGTILECNSALVKILGYDSEEELKKINAGELYFYPEERSLLVGRLKKEGEVTNFELVLKSKQGTKVKVASTVRILKDNTFLGTSIDITNLKKLSD